MSSHEKVLLKKNKKNK